MENGEWEMENKEWEIEIAYKFIVSRTLWNVISTLGDIFPNN